MKKHGILLGTLFSALMIGSSGCVNVTTDDDDDASPAVNSNIQITDFQLSCWSNGTDDYWEFLVTVNDEDGPNDIDWVWVEVIDVSTVIEEFEVPVAVADGTFCTEFGTSPVGYAMDCVECQDYGYRISASDESGNMAEETYAGDICSFHSGSLPEDYVCPGWE